MGLSSTRRWLWPGHYDAPYLELAERRAVPLATLDLTLAQAAQRENISLIGHEAAWPDQRYSSTGTSSALVIVSDNELYTRSDLALSFISCDRWCEVVGAGGSAPVFPARPRARSPRIV